MTSLAIFTRRNFIKKIVADVYIDDESHSSYCGPCRNQNQVCSKVLLGRPTCNTIDVVKPMGKSLL